MPEPDSLSWLNDPNLALVLIAAGIVCILVEMASPGGWIAGIAGAILLALAGVALYGMEFSYVGLALISVGFVLFLVEFNDPDKGLFGAIGVISFAVGGFLLFDERTGLGLAAFGATVAFMCASLAGLWRFARKARNISSQSRDSQIVGQVGTVRAALNPTGTVQVANELWTAESDSGEPIPSGERVMVSEAQGLVLKVFRDPLSPNPQDRSPT